MTMLAFLDRNLWIKGELTEPKLNVLFSPPPTSNVTLTLAVFDSNGIKVTDDYTTTITSGTQSKIIELGDYLNTQQLSKGFTSGTYFILVKLIETNEVIALPLLITLGAYTSPPIPDSQYLQYYTVFDKVTGSYFNLPPTLTYIPSDPRFMVYAYLHKENKGRLIGLTELGTISFDTDYHQLALLTLTLQFTSIKEMMIHILGHSYGLTNNAVMQLLQAINSGDYDTALTLLRPFYMITFIGRVLTVEFDTTNLQIRIKTQTYLGQWDWGRIFTWGAVGCALTTVGLMAGAYVTGGLSLLGLSEVLGACIGGAIAGGLVAVISSASTDKPETIVEHQKKVEEEGEKAKQTNQQYYTSATDLLSSWLQQGKITQDDYNQMTTILNNWKTSMDSAIDDIVNISKKAIEEAYNDGYNKAKDEMKFWIIGAGLGGFILGQATAK